MSDSRSRLLHCFSIVFPKLQEEELPHSSVDSVDDWDSLASVNLYSLVEEEFGVEIRLEDLENLLSFELILEYINGGTGIP